jgi:electron transport complex protein RnfB
MIASPPVKTKDEALIEQIDALLPQTQCGQCGYAGCQPYAAAIAQGEAINQCPPGGAAGVRRLAALLGRPATPLALPEKPPAIARIDEAACIGCTLCIQACPVDAIIGAARQMHTVVAAWCTGCELCLPPCPTVCVNMLPTGASGDWKKAADQARARFTFKEFHTAREKAEKTARLAAATAQASRQGSGPKTEAVEVAEAEKTARAAIIQAAMARAKAQREAAQAGAKIK